jgi:uncharacterized integral membrane protein
MTSDVIFNSGVILCGAAVMGAVVAAIALRLRKARLEKQLDAEFGERRR